MIDIIKYKNNFINILKIIFNFITKYAILNAISGLVILTTTYFLSKSKIDCGLWDLLGLLSSFYILITFILYLLLQFKLLIELIKNKKELK